MFKSHFRLFPRVQKEDVSIGSSDAITRTNYDLIHRRIYESPGPKNLAAN